MHLVKYMLKLIKKSVCICQLSEVKLFFSRLRVKKQVSRVELYVFFTNFFWSLFFPSLDRGVTKIPCAAGVRWQSSQYSWDMISQSLSPYLLPRGTVTVIPVALSSHPPQTTLTGIFLKEGGGKNLSQQRCSLCLNTKEEIVHLLIFSLAWSKDSERGAKSLLNLDMVSAILLDRRKPKKRCLPVLLFFLGIS